MWIILPIGLVVAVAALRLLWAGSSRSQSDPFIEHVRRGNYRQVEAELAAGEDPNHAEDIFVLPPLAARFFTVNEKAARAYRKTVLMIASEEGHNDIVKLLIDRGAHLDTVNASGWSALGCAIEHDRLDTLRLLLSLGADPGITGFEGDTPLILGAKEGKTAIVQALLESGARVDAANSDGGTALMYGAANAYRDVVRLCLSAGASVNLRDCDGKTALDWAEEAEDGVVIAMLEEAGGRRGKQSGT
jgi:ankyrin repeat protein